MWEMCRSHTVGLWGEEEIGQLRKVRRPTDLASGTQGGLYKRCFGKEFHLACSQLPLWEPMLWLMSIICQNLIIFISISFRIKGNFWVKASDISSIFFLHNPKLLEGKVSLIPATTVDVLFYAEEENLTPKKLKWRKKSL